MSSKRVELVRRHQIFSAALLAGIALVLGACASAGTVSTEPSRTTSSLDTPTSLAQDCHFATTVPGGELPQPQCEDQNAVVVTSAPEPSVPRWTCPEEDYPTTVGAGTWQPYYETPDPLLVCGDLAWIDTGPPIVLAPTEPLTDLDNNAPLGLSKHRRPGGHFWHVTLVIPAEGPEVVRLEASLIGPEYFPDGWEMGSDDDLARLCPVGTTALTIRGHEGCRDGDRYAWVDGNRNYELTIDLDLPTEVAVGWIDTWQTVS